MDKEIPCFDIPPLEMNDAFSNSSSTPKDMDSESPMLICPCFVAQVLFGSLTSHHISRMTSPCSIHHDCEGHILKEHNLCKSVHLDIFRRILLRLQNKKKATGSESMIPISVILVDDMEENKTSGGKYGSSDDDNCTDPAGSFVQQCFDKIFPDYRRYQGCGMTTRDFEIIAEMIKKQQMGNMDNKVDYLDMQQEKKEEEEKEEDMKDSYLSSSSVWRIKSGYDVLYYGCEHMESTVANISDEKFHVTAPSENFLLFLAFQLLDMMLELSIQMHLQNKTFNNVFLETLDLSFLIHANLKKRAENDKRQENKGIKKILTSICVQTLNISEDDLEELPMCVSACLLILHAKLMSFSEDLCTFSEDILTDVVMEEGWKQHSEGLVFFHSTDQEKNRGSESSSSKNVIHRIPSKSHFFATLLEEGLFSIIKTWHSSLTNQFNEVNHAVAEFHFQSVLQQSDFLNSYLYAQRNVNVKNENAKKDHCCETKCGGSPSCSCSFSNSCSVRCACPQTSLADAFDAITSNKCLQNHVLMKPAEYAINHQEFHLHYCPETRKATTLEEWNHILLSQQRENQSQSTNSSGQWKQMLRLHILPQLMNIITEDINSGEGMDTRRKSSNVSSDLTDGIHIVCASSEHRISGMRPTMSVKELLDRARIKATNYIPYGLIPENVKRNQMFLQPFARFGNETFGEDNLNHHPHQGDIMPKHIAEVAPMYFSIKTLEEELMTHDNRLRTYFMSLVNIIVRQLLVTHIFSFLGDVLFKIYCILPNGTRPKNGGLTRHIHEKKTRSLQGQNERKRKRNFEVAFGEEVNKSNENDDHMCNHSSLNIQFDLVHIGNVLEKIFVSQLISRSDYIICGMYIDDMFENEGNNHKNNKQGNKNRSYEERPLSRKHGEFDVQPKNEHVHVPLISSLDHSNSELVQKKRDYYQEMRNQYHPHNGICRDKDIRDMILHEDILLKHCLQKESVQNEMTIEMIESMIANGFCLLTIEQMTELCDDIQKLNISRRETSRMRRRLRRYQFCRNHCTSRALVEDIHDTDNDNGETNTSQQASEKKLDGHVDSGNGSNRSNDHVGGGDDGCKNVRQRRNWDTSSVGILEYLFGSKWKEVSRFLILHIQASISIQKSNIVMSRQETQRAHGHDKIKNLRYCCLFKTQSQTKRVVFHALNAYQKLLTFCLHTLDSIKFATSANKQVYSHFYNINKCSDTEVDQKGNQKDNIIDSGLVISGGAHLNKRHTPWPLYFNIQTFRGDKCITYDHYALREKRILEWRKHLNEKMNIWQAFCNEVMPNKEREILKTNAMKLCDLEYDAEDANRMMNAYDIQNEDINHEDMGLRGLQEIIHMIIEDHWSHNVRFQQITALAKEKSGISALPLQCVTVNKEYFALKLAPISNKRYVFKGYESIIPCPICSRNLTKSALSQGKTNLCRPSSTMHASSSTSSSSAYSSYGSFLQQNQMKSNTHPVSSLSSSYSNLLSSIPCRKKEFLNGSEVRHKVFTPKSFSDFAMLSDFSKSIMTSSEADPNINVICEQRILDILCDNILLCRNSPHLIASMYGSNVSTDTIQRMPFMENQMELRGYTADQKAQIERIKKQTKDQKKMKMMIEAIEPNVIGYSTYLELLQEIFMKNEQVGRMRRLAEIQGLPPQIKYGISPDFGRTVMATFAEWASGGCFVDFMNGGFKKLFPSSDCIFTKQMWNICLFQIVWTLSCIHKKWPDFRHNDLHARNVLIHVYPPQSRLSSERVDDIRRFTVYSLCEDKSDIWIVDESSSFGGFSISTCMWDFDFASCPSMGIYNNFSVFLCEYIEAHGITSVPDRCFDIGGFVTNVYKHIELDIIKRHQCESSLMETIENQIVHGSKIDPQLVLQRQRVLRNQKGPKRLWRRSPRALIFENENISPFWNTCLFKDIIDSSMISSLPPLCRLQGDAAKSFLSLVPTPLLRIFNYPSS